MADIKYLKRLSRDYPNSMAAAAEIVNINAILALPKGTEYFLSDLHGEHEAFVHMLKSASGTIKSKIDEHYGGILSDEDRDALAALIYDPVNEIKRRKKSEDDFNKWAVTVIYRLITICKSVSTKYTRSKVRRKLPKYAEYAIDELLHADDEENRSYYYKSIIDTIIETGMAESFIISMANATSDLAVDYLHIIGDIFDRGAHPDYIMDFLMKRNEVDFQWGNHDMVWMGAAAGHWACIANVLRMNISYNNFDMLEIGYGINLRPLAMFANTCYGDDPCDKFMPHMLDRNNFDPVDEKLAAKMHKAIAIMQFKLEGQRIKAHPEYNLEHRLLLHKIDKEKGIVEIEGELHELRECNFPTIDPENPYELSQGEEAVMEALSASFLKSEKLQRHIKFLYSRGALYTIYNGNLLYHGCIPMDDDGEAGVFLDVNIGGKTLKGKALMDHLDTLVRRAYFSPESYVGTNEYPGDIMWYLWLGFNSPLFGKEKMTTFERLFIDDKATHKEPVRPYYELIKRREPCEKIIREFGLDPNRAKILNGHVPVKFKDGESPIKGGGLLYVIDGGISKAYQKKTGIAGYTFIFNSRFMALAQHKPYSPLKADGTQEFVSPIMQTVETLPERMMVIDTDIGKEMVEMVVDLRALMDCYDNGIIKEKYDDKAFDLIPVKY